MDLYRVCGHCKKLVSEKTFKEHKRVFFHEQGWVKESVVAEDVRSRNSSPLCMSDLSSEMPSCISNYDLDNTTNSSNCNFEDMASTEKLDDLEENVRPTEGD